VEAFEEAFVLEETSALEVAFEEASALVVGLDA
jgi:hypothetical protein